tara:strand:+ start:114175 stop:115248 length:1074 start_codon:yes stop_codon:yes gene_type:complete
MPLWLGIDADSGIYKRSYSLGEVTSGYYDAERDDFFIFTPPASTMVHSFELPDLPAKQAMEVARRMALDASLGDPDALHGVASNEGSGDGEASYHVTMIATGEMERLIGWAQGLGLDPDYIIPAGMLLPEPAQGYIRATLGPSCFARGKGLVLPGRGSLAREIMADAPVTDWTGREIDAAILAAVAHPPVNMRSGPFMRRADRGPRSRWLGRMAVLIACIGLLSLLINGVQLVKFHAATDRLDDKAISVAEPFVGQTDTARIAEDRINTLMAASGAGTGSFTALLSLVTRAVQPFPSVRITQIDRGVDGRLRIVATSQSAEDLDSLAQALRTSGLHMQKEPTSNMGSNQSVTISVTP